MHNRAYHECSPKLGVLTCKATLLEPPNLHKAKTKGSTITPDELVPQTAPAFSNREEILPKRTIHRWPILGSIEMKENTQEGSVVTDH
jgi:hypothetical protein